MPRTRRWIWCLLTVTALVLTGGCGRANRQATVERSPEGPSGTANGALPSSPGKGSHYSKVLIIPEENKSYDQVIGDTDAPYLNRLADSYGSATAMDAGYPTDCPSLPAYLIVTSGDSHGICDDEDPAAHPLPGPNVFEQVATTGRQWRVYAESMPANCSPVNTPDGLYLVRHAPGPYYESEKKRCQSWDVPLGTPSAGAFATDLAAGRLPAYSFVVPNACNDMHGAQACQDNRVARGDEWLQQWVPKILSAPDYRSGRLVVVITWDEGTKDDNHIPTVVISPTTAHVTSDKKYTHCSTLRTTEEILGLPLLACAATAPSMVSDFGLR